MMDTYRHTPVLAPRALELLSPALLGDSPLLVDATLGLGGHTEAFLASIPALRVLGIDRDPEALESSKARLAPYGDRVSLRSAVTTTSVWLWIASLVAKPPRPSFLTWVSPRCTWTNPSEVFLTRWMPPWTCA